MASKTKDKEAPGAETATKPAPTSARKNRYSFYPDGNDYVLLGIEIDPQTKLPAKNGKLGAIPNVPRFSSAAEAKAWLNASGNQLEGVSVLCARMMFKATIVVQQKPLVTVNLDQRFAKGVEGTDAEDASANPSEARAEPML